MISYRVIALLDLIYNHRELGKACQRRSSADQESTKIGDNVFDRIGLNIW